MEYEIIILWFVLLSPFLIYLFHLTYSLKKHTLFSLTLFWPIILSVLIVILKPKIKFMLSGVGNRVNAVGAIHYFLTIECMIMILIGCIVSLIKKKWRYAFLVIFIPLTIYTTGSLITSYNETQQRVAESQTENSGNLSDFDISDRIGNLQGY